MERVALASLAMVLLFMPLTGLSQKTFFSVGPEVVFPGSDTDLKRNAGTGFGASVRLESRWGKHIAGMATVSYIDFPKKHHTSPGLQGTTTNVMLIPVQLGLKYYALDRDPKPKGFFVSIEAGLMPARTDFEYASNPDFKFKEDGLSCAVGLGYLLWNIEGSFRLQYNLSASGFNVYYYDFMLAYAFLRR
jgi:hypothetical protein